MRTLALTILTMGIVLTTGHARAQTYDPAYPVCLYVVPWGGGAYYSCSYTTMDQCRAFANGQMCSLNPYYAGATAPVRRNNRRYYRQVESRSPAPAGPIAGHRGRRPATGPHRAIFTMNRISELAKVTRLAKNNNFSTV